MNDTCLLCFGDIDRDDGKSKHFGLTKTLKQNSADPNKNATDAKKKTFRTTHKEIHADNRKKIAHNKRLHE